VCSCPQDSKLGAPGRALYVTSDRELSQRLHAAGAFIAKPKEFLRFLTAVVSAPAAAPAAVAGGESKGDAKTAAASAAAESSSSSSSESESESSDSAGKQRGGASSGNSIDRLVIEFFAKRGGKSTA
jgi:type IV secretory pathway TrbL component